MVEPRCLPVWQWTTGMSAAESGRGYKAVSHPAIPAKAGIYAESEVRRERTQEWIRNALRQHNARPHEWTGRMGFPLSRE